MVFELDFVPPTIDSLRIRSNATLSFTNGKYLLDPPWRVNLTFAVYFRVAEHGAQFGYRIGVLPNGLFAAQKVRAGQTLVSVPSKLCFTRENLAPDGEFVLSLWFDRHG